MKERPILFSAPMVRAILEGRKTQTRRIAKKDPFMYKPPRCPYGARDDRLWVRETWGLSDQGFDTADESTFPVYRADIVWPQPRRWRPSIHMPRALSRILLKVESVRVERLHSISDSDALAEGILHFGDGGYVSDAEGRNYGASAIQSYAYLWDAIHGADAWNENPWVWVVSFRRVQP